MATRRNKSRRPATRGDFLSLTSLQRALLKEGDRQVTITIEGQQQVTIKEVIARKLLQMAANGSVHALSNALNEIVFAERLRQLEIEAKVEIGHKVKKRQQILLDEAIKAGADPDSVLPHPHDIIVVEGEGYRVVGSINEEELAQLKETCRFRDLLIMQDELDRRLADEPEGDDPLDGPGTAFLFASLLNRTLPERHRLDDTAFIIHSMRCEAMPKRQLLKKIHRGWRALGYRVPRGKVLPPLRVGKAHVEIMAGVLRRLGDGRLSDDATVEDFADAIGEIIAERSVAASTLYANGCHD